MAFRKSRQQPQFADLKGILAQSKQTDNSLYQTVQVLIDRLTQYQGFVETNIIQQIDEAIGGVTPPTGDFATKEATYLTTDDETTDLPNSVQILAGTNITFDTSVSNQLTISSIDTTGGGPGVSEEWSVLTNGDVTNPELIYADGDVIMVHHGI